MQETENASQLDDLLASSKDGVIIGFFGDFSAAAKKARPAFEKFCQDHEKHPAALVDVGRVRDVHKRFGVTTVPTVVLAKGDRVLQKVVGPQSPDYYERALIEPSQGGRRSSDDKDAKPAHRVVLYVGASCPWCTRARNYLRKQGIRFREVDVSKDPNAASTLVSRSGQQGVPQVDIDGNWIVGFNKPRINELLGIAGG